MPNKIYDEQSSTPLKVNPNFSKNLYGEDIEGSNTSITTNPNINEDLYNEMEVEEPSIDPHINEDLYDEQNSTPLKVNPNFGDSLYKNDDTTSPMENYIKKIKSSQAKGKEKYLEFMINVLEEESLEVVSAVSMGLLNTAKMYVSTGLSFINEIKDKYYLKSVRAIRGFFPTDIYVDNTIESNIVDPDPSSTNSKVWNTNLIYENKEEWLKKVNKSLVDIGGVSNKKIFEDENDVYKITSKDLYYGTVDDEDLPFSVYIHKLQEANLKIDSVDVDNNDDIKNLIKEKTYDLTGQELIAKYKEKEWSNVRGKHVNDNGVPFIIADLASGVECYFENTITNINDSTSVGWDENRLSGRPDPYYVYAGTSRNNNINFSIVADDIEELKLIQDKVKFLKNLCFPTYENKRPINPFLKLTIGDFVKNQLVKINSLLINPDDSEIGWQIQKSNEIKNMILPYKIDITMDFTILYDKMPQGGEANERRFFATK